MRRRLIADAKRVPKLRANRRILRTLEIALDYAKLERCGVEDVHKNAMRLYLQSWVEGPIQSAIDDMMGIRKSRWQQ